VLIDMEGLTISKVSEQLTVDEGIGKADFRDADGLNSVRLRGIGGKRWNGPIDHVSESADMHVPLIDGVVMTKFDTVSDKVGAALTLTLMHLNSVPIAFYGPGQARFFSGRGRAHPEQFRNLRGEK
jgi:hypothetical protein